MEQPSGFDRAEASRRWRITGNRLPDPGDNAAARVGVQRAADPVTACFDTP